MPWVDGSDVIWQAEKNKYTVAKDADAATNRYRDWDLLRYWFRGVEKFAPWVNKVHFITWGHVPEWLNLENPKLNVVNHTDYIPQKYLPVFSSHPIECNMHKIEGLSEHFVYFNDDMYVINHLDEKDFFVNGKPVDCITEVPLRFFPGGIDHIIANNMTVINKNFQKRKVIKANRKNWFSFRNVKATLKNLYMVPVNGFSAFDNPHIPYPYLKSTFNEVWEKEYEVLDETSSHKFRCSQDVNQWLFRYWQFVTGVTRQSKGPNGRFFIIGKDDEVIKTAILEQKYNMICLSDDDVSLDFDMEKKFIDELFSSILPEKCTFEK